MFTKEEKKFFRGKKWSKKQRKELEKQGSPPLKLNHIDLSKEEIERLKIEIADMLAVSKKDIGKPNTKGCCETMMEHQIRTVNERR